MEIDNNFGKVKLVNLNTLTKTSSASKRKPYRKWTIEQKKSLIISRIKHEALFQECHLKHLSYGEAWRQVVKDAKLGEFGQTFVRKQWQNFITKYKSLLNRDSLSYQLLTEEQIQNYCKRWDFFGAIHNWMIGKSTLNEENNNAVAAVRKLIKRSSPFIDHEYGKRAEATIVYTKSDENIKTTSKIQPRIRVNPNIFKRTYQTVKWIKNNNIISNNDHNYTPTAPRITKISLKEQRKSIGIGNSKMREGKSIPSSSNTAKTNETARIIRNGLVTASKPSYKEIYPVRITRDIPIKQEVESTVCLGEDNDNTTCANIPSETVPQLSLLSESATYPAISSKSAASPKTKKSKKNKNYKHHRRSFEEKIYRHAKKSTKCIEKKLDALLNVFAQIIKHDYPNIDVNPLLNNDENTSTSNSE